jgi:2-polyprenyl-3-methyl-5-hydroxy-6-metoxy-1,4-benzoquinol methylase
MSDPAAPERSTWPRAALEPVSACPVCHSTSRTLLHSDLVDNTFFTAPGAWNMQQCAACGSAYLDPRPTPESISDAYTAYYTHGPLTESRGRGMKALAKSVVAKLSATYIESLANPERRKRPLSRRIGAALVRAVPSYREVVDARYRHLRRPMPGADRLLDIGCGGGEFLDRARFLGWKCEGVDLDPKAVDAARNLDLNVSAGSIDSYADVSGVFDVVTCNHVIEHVYDPGHLIASMYRILKPGGRLWIETPNINSAGHAFFGASWRGLEPPRHLAIMNYQTMVRMLSGAGFSITHGTPWNIQHIRLIFAASEALRAHGNPQITRTPLLPNWRLVKGLLLEALFADRREFLCLRATKELKPQR